MRWSRFFLGSVVVLLLVLNVFLVVRSGVIDPVINLSVNFAWSASIIQPFVVEQPTVNLGWSANIIAPTVVERPTVNFAWSASIIQPSVVEAPAVNFAWGAWVYNSSGVINTVSGAYVSYPWVNCTYPVREGWVIVPDIVGSTISGYVDINVSNTTVLQYLLKNPLSAMFVIDYGSTPLTYYVYDINNTYIIYRVYINNLTDGLHVLWLYAGGAGAGGYPGIPVEVSYTGAPLTNYTVVMLGSEFNEFLDASGNKLPAYSENGVTYVRLPVVNNGSTVFYARYDVNASLGGLGLVSDWFDDFETFTGWVNYSLGYIAWSSAYKYEGSYGVVKNGNNDPNGGYKQLPFTLGSKPFVLEAEIERINTLGGALDRIGVINGSGYGYGFVFDNGLSKIDIDKRSAYTGTTLVGVSVTKPTGWYLAQFYWFPNGTLVSRIIQNGKVVGLVSYTDTSYSFFNYVYIFGGYEYAVDNMRIRFISPEGDLYANEVSIGNAIPLLDKQELAPETAPPTCFTTTTTSTTTTTQKPGAALPPQTTYSPIVTWVSPPNYNALLTTTPSGGLEGVRSSIQHFISNLVVVLQKHPVLLILLLMMVGGFLLIVGAGRRR